MPAISLLLKPASGGCNMRCRYCFYRDEQQNRDTYSYGLMSEATLETVVRKALTAADGSCSFGFQGGEPTVCGLDFFRKAVEFQRKYNVHGVPVYNAIQTNGLALDGEWADFFRENRFLVGLSLDGTKEMHDENRVDASGRGTYGRVMRAAQLLKSHGVDFNVLTVVTDRTAREIGKIYGFFRRNGLLYQQYIPCLAPIGEAGGLRPESYAAFLKTLFDLWYGDVAAGNFIYIRYFENLAAILQGGRSESCDLWGKCTLQNVVEADGSVYPCDFYCLDRWRMGSLVTDSLEDILLSERGREFLRTADKGREECGKCEYFRLCRGGCRRDRETGAAAGMDKNVFCSAYKEFFAYALPRLKAAAGVLPLNGMG